jgi:transcription antitermination factor NusG
LAIEWYALRTKPGLHRVAERELSNQGFRVFLPMAALSKFNHRTGRWHDLRVPLFGPYIFTAFDRLTERWQAIKSTKGVSGFLGYSSVSETVAPIRPPEFVDALMASMEASSGAVGFGQRLPTTVPEGHLVSILFGPYRDREARVSADLGARIEVLLEFAGVKLPVKLSRECLATAA